jgi:DHA1 family tetracycline resistance protein-like MFS transporter
MTKLVSGSEQGQLQGANGAIMALTSMIGPGLFTRTFAHFIEPQRSWQLPGSSFLLAAALLVIAWIVALNAARVDKVPVLATTP